MSAQELADWLAEFWFLGGRIQLTCNGTGIMASDAEGNHYFTLVGMADTDLLFDKITPYL